MEKLTLNEILNLADKVENWKKDYHNYSGEYKGINIKIIEIIAGIFSPSYRVNVEYDGFLLGDYKDRKTIKELHKNIAEKVNSKKLAEIRALLKE